MNTLTLAGCRNDTLLGYLKALGIFRILTGGPDPTARCGWDGAEFNLKTVLNAREVTEYILDEYCPTPIANPWNSGAGFDGKSDNAGITFSRIRNSPGPRWEKYQTVLAFIESTQAVRTTLLAAKDKFQYIKYLRTHCPEVFLEWLDAAIILAEDKAHFPYLLGSGGNDGRLDFGANFAARALDICENEPGRDILLSDALYDTSDGKLIAGAAIGQFSPRHTGGANATAGFTADSLINPYDYVFTLEGCLFFSGTVGRRSETKIGRPLFPFAVRSSPGGYGTASSDEESRGEMWLPVWTGNAARASLIDLIRKGRIDIAARGRKKTARPAVQASEAQTALLTRGVSLGLRQMTRIGFTQRNGLAFSATTLKTIHLENTYNSGIALLSSGLFGWTEKTGSREIGTAGKAAFAKYRDQLFAFSEVPVDSQPRALQNIMITISQIDAALGQRTKNDEQPRLTTKDYLPARVLAALDDNSVEHHIAVAFASMPSGKERSSLRQIIDAGRTNATSIFRDFLERRWRDDEANPSAQLLQPRYYATLSDIATLLEFTSQQRERLGKLIQAYGLINFQHYKVSDTTLVKPQTHIKNTETVRLPAAYALLKLITDVRPARDERILRLLFTQQPDRAMETALRRARATLQIRCRFRELRSLPLQDPVWTAAVLAIPIARLTSESSAKADLSEHPYARLIRSAAISPTTVAEGGTLHDVTKAYIQQILANPTRENKHD